MRVSNNVKEYQHHQHAFAPCVITGSALSPPAETPESVVACMDLRILTTWTFDCTALYDEGTIFVSVCIPFLPDNHLILPNQYNFGSLKG